MKKPLSTMTDINAEKQTLFDTIENRHYFNVLSKTIDTLICDY